MKTKWNVFLVFTVLILSGCVSTTPTPAATSTMTPTMTPTMTYTATLTSTPTLIPTPTPVFPASFEDFKLEMRKNCVPPPVELEITIPTDIPTPVPPSLKLGLKEGAMLSFLFSEVGKDEDEMEYWGIFPEPNYETNEDNWFCRGIIIFPKVERPNVEEDSWAKWNFPVTLAYWSSNGLVVYEYQPENTYHNF